MSMLKKLSAIGAEIESPYGSEATVEADDLFLCYDLNFMPGIESLGRPVYRATLTPTKPVPGARISAVEFKVQPVGSGTAGSIPSIDRLLRACGYNVNTEAGVHNLYQPFDPVQGTSDHESITLTVYQSGLKHILTGCRGTFVLVLEVGQMPHLDFHFEGIDFTWTDDAFVEGTAFDTLDPAVCLNTGLKIEDATLNIPTVNLDIGNVLTRITSLNAVAGTSEIYISDRIGNGTLEPAATLIATSPNLYTKWSAGSKVSLYCTIGSAAGNKIVIGCPLLAIKTLGFGERDGILTNPFTFDMCGPINAITGTSDAGSDDDEVQDDSLFTTDNEYNGGVLTFSSGTHSGKSRMIVDTNGTAKTVTVSPAFPPSAYQGFTFAIEKWEIGIDFQ